MVQNKEGRGFIGSIDQGTTSTRFLIFDEHGTPQASHQIEFKQIYPHPGWIEHDPYELVSSVETCIEEATRAFVADGHSVSDIKAVGITNQRETTVVWDSETGDALHAAIVWPDTRTKKLVRKLKGLEGASELQPLCGLPLSTYPSSVKLVWLIENVPAVRSAYDAGRLAFGTVDSWLLFRLNGGIARNVHVTDPTNASRTMFLNIRTLQYDDRLFRFFGLEREKLKLPRIVPSSDPVEFGSLASGALKDVRIAGCLGDQSSALVGQCAFSPGRAKNTYGTGCFLLCNTGTEPVISKYGLLTTVAYDFGKGRKPVYALEGSIAVAGSAVKFLQDNLKIIASPNEIGELAATVEDSGGVVFVTAFSGLFAPYWIDDAKGTIFGLTQHTQRGHLARATLEATCFQTNAILSAMEKDSGQPLRELAVDGGMSNSDFFIQLQSDILGLPIDRPLMRETTALGTAIAAGFAIGIWRDFEELEHLGREGRMVFRPKIGKVERARMVRRWEQAVEMCRGWGEDCSDDKEGEGEGGE
ncbi:MAG: Glycerol kinase [Trichoglossum hirsutum]|nr:MAG: Glycerol kinase [Trichoglossum hirsutum]